MRPACTCDRHGVWSFMPSARLLHASVICTINARSRRRHDICMLIAYAIHTASTCSYHQCGIYMPMASARYIHTHVIHTACTCACHLHDIFTLMPPVWSLYVHAVCVTSACSRHPHGIHTVSTRYPHADAIIADSMCPYHLCDIYIFAASTRHLHAHAESTFSCHLHAHTIHTASACSWEMCGIRSLIPPVRHLITHAILAVSACSCHLHRFVYNIYVDAISITYVY